MRVEPKQSRNVRYCLICFEPCGWYFRCSCHSGLGRHFPAPGSNRQGHRTCQLGHVIVGDRRYYLEVLRAPTLSPSFFVDHTWCTSYKGFDPFQKNGLKGTVREASHGLWWHPCPAVESDTRWGLVANRPGVPTLNVEVCPVDRGFGRRGRNNINGCTAWLWSLCTRRPRVPRLD